jgi:hypothetical protein
MVCPDAPDVQTSHPVLGQVINRPDILYLSCLKAGDCFAMLAMTKPFLSAILKIIARSGSDVAISSFKDKN